MRTRRARRARLAGLEAVEEFRRKSDGAASRRQIDVRIEVTIWSDGAVVWNIWDASPAFEEQVEGVLVPYAHGQAIGRGEAEVAALDSIHRLNDPRVHLTEIVARWPQPKTAVSTTPPRREDEE